MALATAEPVVLSGSAKTSKADLINDACMGSYAEAGRMAIKHWNNLFRSIFSRSENFILPSNVSCDPGGVGEKVGGTIDISVKALFNKGNTLFAMSMVTNLLELWKRKLARA